MKKSIILAVAFVFALAVCAPVASVAQEPVKKEQSAEKPADKKSDKKEGCCKDKEKACADKKEGAGCCKEKKYAEKK